MCVQYTLSLHILNGSQLWKWDGVVDEFFLHLLTLTYLLATDYQELDCSGGELLVLFSLVSTVAWYTSVFAGWIPRRPSRWEKCIVVYHTETKHYTVLRPRIIRLKTLHPAKRARAQKLYIVSSYAFDETFTCVWIRVRPHFRFGSEI